MRSFNKNLTKHITLGQTIFRTEKAKNEMHLSKSWYVYARSLYACVYKKIYMYSVYTYTHDMGTAHDSGENQQQTRKKLRRGFFFTLSSNNNKCW